MTLAGPPLRQRLAPGALPRHRHGHGYLTVVLAGGYLEAGDGGRRLVVAGDVVVHRPFEAHLNRFPGGGAQVLNLDMDDGGWAGFGRVADPDAVLRAAGRDGAEAMELVQRTFTPAPAAPEDWPDELAGLLREGLCGLGDWARAKRLTPEHVSRGFRKAYGISPQRYRLEARARAAWRDLTAGAAPLAAIAADRGFADQAHMSRAVAAVTGAPPSIWRGSTAFKTPG